MALYFGQRASFSQMARLLAVTEGCARDLVTRNPLGKSSIIDLARMFKLALARLDKTFVDAKLKFVGLDCGIFGISHRVQCANHCARWRDLMKGCNLSSGRFTYTTIGQSIKQQNSEWNALRMREIVFRSPNFIPLRFTAEGGVSFRVAPRQPHSDEFIRRPTAGRAGIGPVINAHVGESSSKVQRRCFECSILYFMIASFGNFRSSPWRHL
jgi:hypothetical protein